MPLPLKSPTFSLIELIGKAIVAQGGGAPSLLPHVIVGVIHVLADSALRAKVGVLAREGLTDPNAAADALDVIHAVEADVVAALAPPT